MSTFLRLHAQQALVEQHRRDLAAEARRARAARRPPRPVSYPAGVVPIRAADRPPPRPPLRPRRARRLLPR